MKLAMVFYRHHLTRENFLYARQLGCTHLVIHLVDYFHREKDPVTGNNQPVGDADGWGVTRNRDVWSYEELRDIRKSIEDEGLVLEAIENFDPGFWYDVLLDGPKKAEQMEGLKQLIRNIGRAGIPIMGYNFSLAGVASRISGPFARGGAESVGVDGCDSLPLPRGMVWNMFYDPEAPKEVNSDTQITSEELWKRFAWFLEELLPVAEESSVKMAAHPDDPPFATLRGTPRLVWRPELYQRLLDLKKSHSNTLELCVGTLAEMNGCNFYDAIESYAKQNAIGYIHLRNVEGQVPRYRETFIDEGDIDIYRVLKILRRNDFRGAVIPDHSPLVSSPAPWHVGMAYALGYIKAMMQRVEKDCRD
ncbi:Mannonate dehydratase [bioreactor metagenome]|jgi:mannonate dehydratase|uniref:mannonate dehydratase n=3 Tax=root TaxID=1 RepID=A0A644YAS2_9ZZZZ|nr:mannonate dehydratase [Aminivibrio sp.]MBP6333796.1 mannonate dehydratase [Aminivibrio sp.]MEA4952896.1 mannonate dehydratase [Aminivibrio sp.]